MLELLGVGFVIWCLSKLTGAPSTESAAPVSEEHAAAKAIAHILQKQGEANAAEVTQTAKAVKDAAQSAAPFVTPSTPSTLPDVKPIVAPSSTPVVQTPQGPATPAAAPAPFPAAVPPSLPAWPDNWPGGQPPGWRFATVTPNVVKRATALLSQLWATGVGTSTKEQTDGVWTVYNAEWHNAAKTIKGVTAYQPKASV